MARSDTDTGGTNEANEQHQCRGCGTNRNVVEKYDAFLCPDCFGEIAREMGFEASGRDEPEDEEFEEWDALRAVTQDTRAAIVADIVGHPKEMASVRELDHTNPRVERSAIEEHLRTLIDVDVVAKEQLPVGERSRDLPYTFYRVTDAARDLFKRNGIFDRETWREQYAKVQKTDDVLAAERAKRPSVE